MTVHDTQAQVAIDFSDDELRRLAEALLLPRVIEERMLTLLRQGRLSKWFSGIGQEAIAVGVTSALRPDDYVLPMHRNLGVFTTRGLPLDRLLRQLLGKAGGYTAGRDRTFHFGDTEHHVIGMISHLAAMLPVADGLALAGQLRGTGQVAAAFIGEGATSEGDFHEAVNLAAVWRLPVLFVVENNGYALSTPTSEQFACDNLADRAVGYGMAGAIVDGNDLLEVVRATRIAAERARRGDGPTLLEFRTFRMRGHEEASGIDYVPRELLDRWAKEDPVERFETVLDARDVLDEAERSALRARLQTQVADIAQAVLAESEPDSTPEQELADVYAPPVAPPLRRQPAGADEDLRYIDAISAGLREAMRADESVILLGQDIAEYGGAFKVTAGFVEEFGRERVRNTPIIESGALGAALGLALAGFRTVVEMQFGDFISCGFNQLVNNLAKTHYRWGAGVPVVVRAPVGGGSGAGPFHSQNVEAWFTHVPGLKVVAPATPADAKGLLLAALYDGNPVLYLEHKHLYRPVRGSVPTGWHAAPIGKASIARRGRDVTIVTYGVGVHWALEAAEAMAGEGREVEVVDLRTLLPWDVETVLESVARTNRAIVLHEAPVTGGFGAEVAATISCDAFADLDAPVTRLGALDTPIPFAKALEELYSPRARLIPAIRDLLAF